MKRFLYILACLLLSFCVKAQPLLDGEGEPIPFALSTKYNNLIDLSKVKSCILKSYNNDSLYIKYNKDKTEMEDVVIGMPAIDTLLNLKTKATKYRINEGTLWLYRIESKTAEMLYVEIEKFEIPERAYLCIFPKKSELNLNGPKFFDKKDIANRQNIHQFQYGNQIFIEYFEPKGSVTSKNIIIKKIGYMFAIGEKNIIKRKKAPPSKTGIIMLII